MDVLTGITILGFLTVMYSFWDVISAMGKLDDTMGEMIRHLKSIDDSLS